MVQDGRHGGGPVLAQGDEGVGLQVTLGWALAGETGTTAGRLARGGFGLGTAIQEGCSGGKGGGPRGEEPQELPMRLSQAGAGCAGQGHLVDGSGGTARKGSRDSQP